MIGIIGITTIMIVTTATMEMFMAAEPDLCLEHVIRVIPHNFISIHFGGYPYYYYGGYYYGYYNGFYRPIFPPFGLHISVLPFGYVRLFIGGLPYYYYNGIYYGNMITLTR